LYPDNHRFLLAHSLTGHLRARERRWPVRYALSFLPFLRLRQHLPASAREFKSRAAKAIWDFEGIYATSRHVPGVRFAGVSHPGLIGTAPSPELLATWNKREKELIDAHPGAVPPVAFPPEPIGAYVGQELPEDVREKVAREGARTIPGREHGGNCDVRARCPGSKGRGADVAQIKNLSRGSRCYFPVFVKGANLSVGDLHFSQGDGEVYLLVSSLDSIILTWIVDVVLRRHRNGTHVLCSFLNWPLNLQRRPVSFSSRRASSRGASRSLG
jgi:acetamidase/formamidase